MKINKGDMVLVRGDELGVYSWEKLFRAKEEKEILVGNNLYFDEELFVISEIKKYNNRILIYFKWPEYSLEIYDDEVEFYN